MDIYTIIRNIDNTIKGKEYLLSTLHPNSVAEAATMEFLRLNIKELYAIRADIHKLPK